MNGVLWLLACSGAVERVEHAALDASPLGAIDRTVDRTPFEGRADEVRVAGGYEYVSVDGRWAVGLRKDIDVGELLEVRPVGVARDFRSARTT